MSCSKQRNKADMASEMPCKLNYNQSDSLTVSNEDSPFIDDYSFNKWYDDGCNKAKEIMENNMLCFDIRTN